MSQENIEIVGRMNADDVEWNTAADMPDSETCKA